MPTCDHFVYTAGKIGNNEGYQVIAKSSGVTKQIISNLTEYLYPLGVKVSDFKESRSLLILPQGKISYSIVKNIGIGYDGRRGTLYNHTFVIDKSDFEKLDFDSRIFEKYFIKNESLRGELKPVKIEPSSISPDFELLEKLGSVVLEILLHRLFRRNKIAIKKTDELSLIQNLIAVLPPTMRLIPFSTLVEEPDRQFKFDLIQIHENAQRKLDKNFIMIDPDENDSSIYRKYTHDENIEHLVKIILKKDEKMLKNFHEDFEKIPEQLSRTRRIKMDELFNETDFESLAKENNFLILKNQVQKLYSSRKFNEASPTIIVSITKKLRKILNKELKKSKIHKKKTLTKIEHIFSILKILLDSMNYLQNSQKRISPTVKNKITDEIIKLEEISNEYFPSETSETPYVFNYFEYLRQSYENIANIFALSLWGMWKR